ncbi:MAG: hypothetical protein R3A10_04780 [Caldilineaceae bacterium]
MVINPAVPPYSSTTKATWLRCFCISLNSALSFLVTGTNRPARNNDRIGWSVVPFLEAAEQIFGVEETENAVDIAFVDRNAAMARFVDDSEGRRKIRFHFSRNHVDARDHGLAARWSLQFKMLAIISRSLSWKLVFLLADMHQGTQTVIGEEDALFSHQLIIADHFRASAFINEDTGRKEARQPGDRPGERRSTVATVWGNTAARTNRRNTARESRSPDEECQQEADTGRRQPQPDGRRPAVM